MSDFGARFRIKLVHFREQKNIFCLINLQAKCKIGRVNEPAHLHISPMLIGNEAENRRIFETVELI